MRMQHFFDPDTSTLTYVVFDPDSKHCVIVDPVLDFDASSGTISTKNLKILTGFIDQNRLIPQMILETHAHADHLSSGSVLRGTYKDARLAIGARIVEVQKIFAPIFNLPKLAIDGSQFDELLKDGDLVHCGKLSFKVLHTPGHTPACSTYVFGSYAFVGDLIFMPDSGTGRCDFPGGDARAMYRSIKNKIYTLPDQTECLVGHDYQPQGRQLLFRVTVAEQKQNNIHIKNETLENDFVERRQTRDQTLNAPRLLYPSVQFNIDGGHLQHHREAGEHGWYFKIPIRTDPELTPFFKGE